MRIQTNTVFHIGGATFDSEDKARQWLADQVGRIIDKALSDAGAVIGPKTAPRGKAFRGETRQTALNSTFRGAMHGTDTGWWNDLIYTAPMLAMASRYRSDIAAAVRDYLSETGENLGATCDRGGELTWADVLASTARRATWDDYLGEHGRDKETAAMALLWGLRFAVEYITGNLAREYCPDL